MPMYCVHVMAYMYNYPLTVDEAYNFNIREWVAFSMWWIILVASFSLMYV